MKKGAIETKKNVISCLFVQNNNKCSIYFALISQLLLRRMLGKYTPLIHTALDNIDETLYGDDNIYCDRILVHG